MHNSDSIGVSASVTDSEVGQLMEAIFLRYSYDFRDYSGPSQRRRVAYALQKLGYSSIAALQDKLLLDADMFSRMLQFLTIPVTSMFRDPAFYLALREYVIPWLRTYASLKIWIAGCSSGEEVYSMAILLREEGLLDRAIIYATDINQQSLEKARKGVYALDGISAGTANYQQAGGLGAFSDYYMASYNAALFDRSLCDNVIFADHSLATDSVFSETHLICCRNVLIYFNKKLRNRTLVLFHESLCHNGFLGLGSKESLDFSAYAGHFQPVVKQQRLFRKI